MPGEYLHAPQRASAFRGRETATLGATQDADPAAATQDGVFPQGRVGQCAVFLLWKKYSGLAVLESISQAVDRPLETVP